MAGRIGGLFTEIPANHQQSVDYYLETGIFRDDLMEYINGARKEDKNIEAMLRAELDLARGRHLPVICVDAAQRQFGSYNHKNLKYSNYWFRGNSRDEDMMTVIREQYSAKGGKWLFVGGSAHLMRGEFDGSATVASRLSDIYKDKFYTVGMFRIGTDSPNSKIACFENRLVLPCTQNQKSAPQLNFNGYLQY